MPTNRARTDDLPTVIPLEVYRRLCVRAGADPDLRVLALLASGDEPSARIVSDVTTRSGVDATPRRELRLSFESGPRGDVLVREIDAAIARYTDAGAVSADERGHVEQLGALRPDAEDSPRTRP